jgi:two-component system, cell cycle response regulator
MPRKFQAKAGTGRRILLVDDDPEYLEITGRILRGEGHDVSMEPGGRAALSNLKDNFYDLLLIDYYMPGMTGEEMITEVRRSNPIVQIVLQTGYANEQPPREIIKRLDIQGYFNKSEGPDKLLLWVDVGLKAAYNLQLLHQSREGLKYILSVTPEMHRIQSLDDLLQGVLLQIAGLFGAADSFLAVLPYGRASIGKNAPEGFVATIGEDSRFVIRAGTGKFAERRELTEYLAPSSLETVRSSLDENRIMSDGRSNIVPLTVGDARIGVIYIDREIDDGANAELLRIFANQAAVAIHNSRLYEMATIDPLTKVFQRGMFMQAFLRELRVSYRSGAPLCLIMIDVNGMKAINDLKGHLAGDKALALVGQAMNFATRLTDIRGRVGGDEFAALLVNSREGGASIVMDRMREFLAARGMEENAVRAEVSCAMGASFLPATEGADGAATVSIENAFFQHMARLMILEADDALYEEKRSGARASSPRSVAWIPVGEAPPDITENDYGFK